MDLSDLSPTVTIGTLVGMVVIGVVPKVPVWAKILVQVVIGVAIYMGLSDSQFNLPYGDDLPLPSLCGGSAGVPGFNKLSMGFLSAFLGVIVSLIAFGIGKLFGKKRGDADS